MDTERIVEKSIFVEPTFDVHFHCGRPHDFEETIGIIKKEMEIIGLKKVLMLSLSFHTPNKHDYDQNLRCLAYKNLFNGAVYASASLKQDLDLTDEEASNDYLKQAETYFDAGFDGMKFLEGHPSFIKLFGHLKGKRFDKMFAFLEENGIPFTIHNADPRGGWDINKVDAYALKHGRFYGDGTFATFEECRDSVLELLKRYPKLKMCLAHGAFLNNEVDRPYFEEFMNYENTTVDVAATGATYNWSQDPDYFIPFIEKYQDKIKYGSDTHNSAPYDYEGWEWDIQFRPKLPRNVLMTDGKDFDMAGKKYSGLGISKEICRKIFYDNAIKEFGENPKKANLSWMEKEISELREVYKDNEYKFNDLALIEKYL